MKKIIGLLFPIFLFFSCYNGAFDDVLFRTTSDPFYDTPEADSLTLEHTVYLTWQADEACDEFLLMRSSDATLLSFECIYRGKGTNYTDTSLPDGQLYIYRLDKIRGKKCFTGNTYAYGFSSDCRKDEYEGNDTQQNSTLLEYDRICNLPCITYNTQSKTFLDEDWFSLSIPPRRTAEIVISQANLSGNASAGSATNLMVQVPGSSGNPVSHLTAFQIENPAYETKTYYFKVYPNTTGLFSSERIFVIEYTVSLNQIINYTSS